MASAQKSSDDMITDINVTPLVDIILVLLIIFMLTANLIARPSIEVELPEASTGEGSEPTTLAITLAESGELFLNGLPTDEEKIRAYVPEVLQADAKAQAIIAADKNVTHGRVVRIIDLVRSLGIYKFALNIEPTGEPP
jgi:biopolymer transport protein ExbD